MATVIGVLVAGELTSPSGVLGRADQTARLLAFLSPALVGSLGDPALWFRSRYWHRRDVLHTAGLALGAILFSFALVPFISFLGFVGLPPIFVAFGNSYLTLRRLETLEGDDASEQIKAAQKLTLGFGLFSLALLVYAVSAALSASSAALFVGAYLLRERAVSGSLGLAGSLALLGGFILVAVSVGLLTVSLSRLRTTSDGGRKDIQHVAGLAYWLLLFFYLFLPIIGLFLLEGARRRGATDALVPLLGAIGGAALVLLAAMALPPVLLSLGRRRQLALVGGGLATLSVVAQTVLAINQYDVRPTVPDWLTFGGLPLINASLPFGLMMSVGILLLWRAARTLNRFHDPLDEPSSRSLGRGD